MKKPYYHRNLAQPHLFAHTDEAAKYRFRIRSIVVPVVWIGLSSLFISLYIFSIKDNIQRFAIVGLSLVKYLPILSVAYIFARKITAKFLADVLDIDNEFVTNYFIEEAAFGEGSRSITLNEDKISDNDERSPIVCIGGPGYIQVNQDTIVLLEYFDGTTRIIYPQAKPWKLKRFERICEIGNSDDKNKSEYAIISLQDQFASGLSVSSRTKDGIPLEAQDIKIMFSVLIKQKGETSVDGQYRFDEKAVYSLVNNQTVITPPMLKKAEVPFPWGATVIPLVSDEMENLIKSRTLSEILSSISYKELDDLMLGESINKQMRIEATGEHVLTNINTFSPPNFESRSKITAQFFSDEFKTKAANLGVAIHWIDIGTWQLPSEIFLEKLMGGWHMMRENAQQAKELVQLGKIYEMREFINLVISVVISTFYTVLDSPASTRKYSEIDYMEIAKMMEENPEIAFNPLLQQHFSENMSSKRDARSVARAILKAFRKEVIAAHELIQKENRPTIDKQFDLAKIEKMLRDIDYHVFHYIMRQ